MNQNNNRNFIGKTYHGSGIKGKLFKYLPVEKNIEIFVGPIPKQEQLI